MGWTFFQDYNTHQSRADIIRREFTQEPTERNPWRFGFESIAERGAVVYAIMYSENPSENTPRRYFGLITLTERKAGRFGYKDMTEDAGPYYYTAPLGMINKLDQLAPNPSQYAAGWRQGVRDYHARKAAKAKAKREARAKLADFLAAHVQFIHITG